MAIVRMNQNATTFSRTVVRDEIAKNGRTARRHESCDAIAATSTALLDKR